MLQKRDGVPVSTDAGMRGSQGTASLRSTNFGEGSVMMWSAISYAETQLVHIHGNLNAARYRDEVMTPNMLPASAAHNSCYCSNVMLISVFKIMLKI